MNIFLPHSISSFLGEGKGLNVAFRGFYVIHAFNWGWSGKKEISFSKKKSKDFLLYLRGKNQYWSKKKSLPLVIECDRREDLSDSWKITFKAFKSDHMDWILCWTLILCWLDIELVSLKFLSWLTRAKKIKLNLMEIQIFTGIKKFESFEISLYRF